MITDHCCVFQANILTNEYRTTINEKIGLKFSIPLVVSGFFVVVVVVVSGFFVVVIGAFPSIQSTYSFTLA